MPENGHLNGARRGGAKKGIFKLPLILGSVEGGEGCKAKSLLQCSNMIAFWVVLFAKYLP